jgi:ribonuclease P protein component
MFKAVLQAGKSMKSPPLSLRYLRNSAPAMLPNAIDSVSGQPTQCDSASPLVDTVRLGFIVRKKTGNAVMRNSMRRVLREAFRARMDRIKTPAWLVFDVLPQASTLTRRTLRLKGEELMERYLRQTEGSEDKLDTGKPKISGPDAPLSLP